MIVDPTSFPKLPTSTFSYGHPSSTVAPMPSVIPTSVPEIQAAGDTGKRTLWLVFQFHDIYGSGFH